MHTTIRAPWRRLPNHSGIQKPQHQAPPNHPHRRRLTSVAASLAALAMVLGLGLLAPGTASAVPFCGITWGSLDKSTGAPGTDIATIFNLRSGRHACFDRLVVDLRGDALGATVRYVAGVTEDGSGFSVPVRGGAFLEVYVYNIAHDAAGHPTFKPANRNEAVNVAGFQTFRQVAFRGTFEGRTLIGVGVRVRLPFRTVTLDGPGDQSRLVIDVAHRW
jgi:hypothetical protein